MLRRVSLIIVLTLLAAAVVAAVAPSLGTQGARAPGLDLYDAYGELLTRFVRDGRVDYRALVTDRPLLDRVVDQVAHVLPSQEQRWTREERLAFWINAYNVITLRSIVDHYPIRGSLFTLYPRNSIRQIDGVWTTQKWLAAGRMVTLDAIEHDILRPTFKDPRVHFAVNCASRSCPPLGSKPYIGREIDGQLDDSTRRFLASEQGVRMSNGHLLVSSIFKWYGGDFAAATADGRAAPAGDTEPAIRAFIERYGSPAAVATAKAGLPVRFLAYDWSLNDIDRPHQ